MLLAISGSVQAYSPKPDLTAAGAIAALKTDANSSPTYDCTYNLGPTGLREQVSSRLTLPERADKDSPCRAGCALDIPQQCTTS
jgi:hypothetical protein